MPDDQPSLVVNRALTMPLKRDQVLAFVIQEIARYGLSPTTGEIARELRISNTRAKQLIVQLVEAGAIDRVPGSVRGLRVRDMAGSRRVLTDVLRRLGWPAADPADEIRGAPGQPTMVAIVANVSGVDPQMITEPLLPRSDACWT